MIKGIAFFDDLKSILPVTKEMDSKESISQENPYMRKPLSQVLVDYTNPVTKIVNGSAGSKLEDGKEIFLGSEGDVCTDEPAKLEEKVVDPIGIFKNWNCKVE